MENCSIITATKWRISVEVRYLFRKKTMYPLPNFLFFLFPSWIISPKVIRWGQNKAAFSTGREREMWWSRAWYWSSRKKRGDPFGRPDLHLCQRPTRITTVFMWRGSLMWVSALKGSGWGSTYDWGWPSIVCQSPSRVRRVWMYGEGQPDMRCRNSTGGGGISMPWDRGQAAWGVRARKESIWKCIVCRGTLELIWW